MLRIKSIASERERECVYIATICYHYDDNDDNDTIALHTTFPKKHQQLHILSMYNKVEKFQIVLRTMCNVSIW